MYKSRSAPRIPVRRSVSPAAGLHRSHSASEILQLSSVLAAAGRGKDIDTQTPVNECALSMLGAELEAAIKRRGEAAVASTVSVADSITSFAQMPDASFRRPLGTMSSVSPTRHHTVCVPWTLMDIFIRTDVFVKVSGHVGSYVDIDDNVFETMLPREAKLVNRARKELFSLFETWSQQLADVPMAGVLCPIVEKADVDDSVCVYVKLVPIVSQCRDVWENVGSLVTTEDALILLTSKA